MNITLQFSTTADSPANWASALIRRMCHSPFSHVDFVLDDGNLLGASDNPTAPFVVGNPRGVAIRPVNYQAFGVRRQMVICTNKAGIILDFAKSQLGKPFDSGALQDFFSENFPGHRDWRENGRWFCAELVIWAFERALYWQTDLLWPKNRVSPTDIFLIFLTDPNWVNRETFWSPVQGLTLGGREH